MTRTMPSPSLVLGVFLLAAGCAGGRVDGGTGAGGNGAAGAGTGGATAGAGGQAGTGGGVGLGGSGAAGAGTAGGAGSGTDAGDPAPTGAGGSSVAVLTDDFESGTAGSAPTSTKWTVDINGGGTVTVDGTVAHQGTKSLHVVPGSFHAMAMVKGAPLFPLPGGVLYGRTYLRLKSAPGNNHYIWIEAGSIMNDVAETRIGANLGVMDINRWPGDTEQRAPGVTFVGAQWYCVEFMFDKTNNEARVWRDGTEITDLHVTDWVSVNGKGNNTTPIPSWAPDYQAVRFGWELNADADEIWFDDVALGYARIGCL
jgi:hypothetical protein